jgi:hypothetical protein
MIKYNKILVGKRFEKKKCFANDGDILVIASDKDKFKGRLPKNAHFFVSINDRLPSIFGWVKETDKEYTAVDIARLDYKSKFKKEPENDSFISKEELDKYEDYLKKINQLADESTMAVDWREKTNLTTYQKEKKLWFHKVVFYNKK